MKSSRAQIDPSTVPIIKENCDDQANAGNEEKSFSFERIFIKEEPREDNEEECNQHNLLFEGDINVKEEEPEVFNISSDVEITIEEKFKPEEPEDCLDPLFGEQDFSRNSPSTVIKDGPEPSSLELNISRNSLSTVYKDDPEEHSPLKFQTPSRTYERSSAVKRPASWGVREKEKENIKVRKVEEVSQLCVNTKNTSSPVQLPSVKKIKGENKSKLCYKTVSSDNKVTVYDRRHRCVYCKERVLSIVSHLLKSHFNEPEVSPLKLLLKEREDGSKRLQYLTRIKRIGDFQHNMNVLATNSSELIVLRNSESLIGQHPRKQFISCPDCTGFVHQSQLEHHHRRCILKQNVSYNSERKLVKESHAMMMSGILMKLETGNRSTTGGDRYFKEEFLDKLSASKCGRVAARDSTLVLLGKYIVLSDKSQNVFELVSEIMRTLGCILMTCRRITSNTKLYFDKLIDPNNVTLLIETVKTVLLAKYEKLNSFDLFSSLYYHIIDCVFILRGKFLLTGLLQNAEKVLDFYYVFVLQWKKEIVFSVNEEECYKKTTPGNILPHISTIMNVKDFLTSKIVGLINLIKDLGNDDSNIISYWYDLAEATITLLSFFNPIPFNVIEHLKVSEYAVRPDWSVDNLNDYETKMSCTTYHLAAKRFIVCINKDTNKEHVLLFTKEIKRAIDILIMKRNEVAVAVKNPYVFAKLHGHNTFRAVNCVYNLCVKSGMLNSNILRNFTTKQYVAYVTQISDMSRDEIGWLRKHLSSNDSRTGTIDSQLVQILQVYDIHQVFEENKNDLREVVESKQTSYKMYTRNQLQHTDKGYIEDAGKRSWSESEKEYIMAGFEEEIKNEELPKKEKCVEFSMKSENLSWNSIRNFVMYTIEENKRQKYEINRTLFCDSY